MQTFIRWAGSKKQSISTLREFWAGERLRYIEPFCGSACLFFELEPEDAVLGDLNSELIETLRAVQRDVDLVLDCLHRLPSGPKWYYRIRALDVNTLTEPERAARFIYLNHFCFNGLYRTDLRGRFNVPIGHSRNKREIDEELLVAAAKVLQNAVIVQSDFEETLCWARPGDFVYLDPPYIVKDRRIFSEYCANTFDESDLGRLGKSLGELDSRGVGFAITYADSSEARRMFARWKLRRLRVRRNIAGFVGARGYEYELLATNLSLEG